MEWNLVNRDRNTGGQNGRTAKGGQGADTSDKARIARLQETNGLAGGRAGGVFFHKRGRSIGFEARGRWLGAASTVEVALGVKSALTIR